MIPFTTELLHATSGGMSLGCLLGLRSIPGGTMEPFRGSTEMEPWNRWHGSPKTKVGSVGSWERQREGNQPQKTSVQSRLEYIIVVHRFCDMNNIFKIDFWRADTCTHPHADTHPHTCTHEFIMSIDYYTDICVPYTVPLYEAPFGQFCVEPTQPNQASTLGFKFSRWPELPRNIGSALSFSCFVVSGLKAVLAQMAGLNNKWWTAEWQQHKPTHQRGAFVIVLFYHHLHSLSHAFYARSALGFRDFMWIHVILGAGRLGPTKPLTDWCQVSLNLFV